MNPTDSAGALGQLQQTQSQAKDPSTILQEQNQQLGVNNAQQTVTGLRGAINNTTKLLNQVAPSVMGRTANSLVTNAQATRQIGNEQAPISKDLTQEGTDYNQATTDLGNIRQEAQTAASGIYQGQQDKLSYAQNLYNTLYQKERDAQAAQEAEANRQEQVRQFNATMAAKNSSSGNGGFNLSSGTPAATVDPQQQQAANALTALFKTNDPNIVSRTIAAIRDSAGRGNTYDKTKLQLIDMYKKSSPYASLITKAGG